MPLETNTVEWNDTIYPDFEGRKVFILSGAFYTNAVAMFAKAGFKKASSIEDADVVVFLGGSDVSPSLYNRTKHEKTYFDEKRDASEALAYNKCLEKGKIMFGICRGAQFLHIMNGGELWQHVNNHSGTNHWIIDLEEDYKVKANSLHHQMLIQHPSLDVLAVCETQVATNFEIGGDSEGVTLSTEVKGDEPLEIEIEAGAYDKTNCIFVQGHPEIGSDEYSCWSLTKLYDFVVSKEDLTEKV